MNKNKILFQGGNYLCLSLLPKNVTDNAHSQVESHALKQRDFEEESQPSLQIWNQQHLKVHQGYVRVFTIVYDEGRAHPVNPSLFTSWRHLPKTQMSLKILERHSASTFLLLSAFHFSVHLHVLLQPSTQLPRSSRALGIPFSHPISTRQRLASFNILSK